MKAFKGKSYVAPVEKDRKEQGKHNEKLDQKMNSSRRKISQAHNPLPSKFGTVTKNKNRKLGFGDYMLIGVLLALVCLFIFLVISVIIYPGSPEDNKEKNEV